MISLRSFDPRPGCVLLVLALAPLLAGCWTHHSTTSVPPLGAGTNDAAALRTDPLHVSDSVRVEFSGAPNAIQPVDTVIKGDGTIRLDYVGDVHADGRTPGELEKEIQKKYVPEYYTHLNVTVTPEARYFYVQGEINNSSGGRILYTGPITVTRAIAAAGDFNAFANKHNVRLYRAGEPTYKVVNCIKALEDPRLDLPVYPGDKILIKRRFW